jgi:hypothetical protein
MTDEFLASEAKRLINDRVLQRALADVRLDYMNELVDADASNMAEVLRLQSGVHAVDDLLGMLRRYVEAVGESDD